MSNNFGKFARTTFKQPSRNVIVAWSCIFKMSQHTFDLKSRYASGIDCFNIVSISIDTAKLHYFGATIVICGGDLGKKLVDFIGGKESSFPLD
jgi:hypothetical protein